MPYKQMQVFTLSRARALRIIARRELPRFAAQRNSA